MSSSLSDGIRSYQQELGDTIIVDGKPFIIFGGWGDTPSRLVPVEEVYEAKDRKADTEARLNRESGYPNRGHMKSPVNPFAEPYETREARHEH